MCQDSCGLNACIHTCMRAYMCKERHGLHACIHAWMCQNSCGLNACIHTCMRAYMCKERYAYIHRCPKTAVNWMHACTNTRIHTCNHEYGCVNRGMDYMHIHMHTHMHTHMQRRCGLTACTQIHACTHPDGKTKRVSVHFTLSPRNCVWVWNFFSFSIRKRRRNSMRPSGWRRDQELWCA